MNSYSFTKDGKKTTLAPLCSKDVFSNQLKLERKRKEFEEKELREKKEVSEKLDKNLQERKSGVKSEKQNE